MTWRATSAQALSSGELTYNWTLQADWGPSSMLKPFGDLWYLLSLAQFCVWRPFAMEVRYTVVVHAALGVGVGYTMISTFLGLHRTVTLMPFFLLGHLLRQHGGGRAAHSCPPHAVAYNSGPLLMGLHSAYHVSALGLDGRWYLLTLS